MASQSILIVGDDLIPQIVCMVLPERRYIVALKEVQRWRVILLFHLGNHFVDEDVQDARIILQLQFLALTAADILKDLRESEEVDLAIKLGALFEDLDFFLEVQVGFNASIRHKSEKVFERKMVFGI
jgi:hypothetical protein